MVSSCFFIIGLSCLRNASLKCSTKSLEAEVTQTCFRPTAGVYFTEWALLQTLDENSLCAWNFWTFWLYFWHCVRSLWSRACRLQQQTLSMHLVMLMLWADLAADTWGINLENVCVCHNSFTICQIWHNTEGLVWSCTLQQHNFNRAIGRISKPGTAHFIWKALLSLVWCIYYIIIFIIKTSNRQKAKLWAHCHCTKD